MLAEATIEKDADIPADLPLFKGIPPEKVGSVLHCLNARLVTCKKGDVIARSEERRQFAGYLIEGGAVGIRYDFWGNRSIIGDYPAGSVIAGDVLFNDATIVPLTIVAGEDCRLLNFSIDQEVKGCVHCMRYANIVRDNVVQSLLDMNGRLMKRLDTLSNRSTREKLLSYLTEQADACGTSTFRIPFNRQELADYLYIERTALSRELGNMQRDGLIAFERSRFTLLPTQG